MDEALADAPPDPPKPSPAAAAAAAPPTAAAVAVLQGLRPQLRRPLAPAHAGDAAGLAALAAAGAADAATAGCARFAGLLLTLVSRHPDGLGPHRAALARAAEALASTAHRKPILALLARIDPNGPGRPG